MYISFFKISNFPHGALCTYKKTKFSHATSAESSCPETDQHTSYLMDTSSRANGNRRKRAERKLFHTLMTGKVRHLKKKDGEPLWRADIQYDFLSAIFRNEQKVFTSIYHTELGAQFSFADIYIEAMAESTRCSKVLSEKLRTDREAGIGIAMVCLLVNIGRMNTTLNFFPEMKAQLRTYHPIPSLQSNSNTDYKQLQDAPRLKSILKGACENRPEPLNYDELKKTKAIPRTNPVNLLFLMTSYVSRIEDTLFGGSLKFYDLLMDSDSSSASRAKSFLWVMWAWLESDMSPEQLKKNPFGIGQTRVPKPESLTPEQKALENIDTPSEISFGKQKTLQRLTYLEGTPVQPPKRRMATISQTSTPPLSASIPTPKSSRDRKTHDEFLLLLKDKRRERRERRAKVGNLKFQWRQIKDLDTCYDSETEFACRESGPTDAAVASGVTAAGGDFGEFASAVSRTMKVHLRRMES